MIIPLKIGKDTCNISIPEEKVISVIMGKDIPSLNRASIEEKIKNGLRKSLPHQLFAHIGRRRDQHQGVDPCGLPLLLQMPVEQHGEPAAH